MNFKECVAKSLVRKTARNKEKRRFYESRIIQGAWSVRELREQKCRNRPLRSWRLERVGRGTDKIWSGIVVMGVA